MPTDHSRSKTNDARKPGRLRRLVQNLVLFAGVFLLCAVVVEIGLRLAGYGKLEIYQPDAKLYWRLRPNQECYTKVGHQPVHINSHGTRGPEFATAKPANTVRVLSLGDSRTFGWGLPDEKTYARQLEALLQQHLDKGKTVEVINAGVNAWSFPQMQVFFRDIGLKWAPDFVVLAEANLWTQFSEKNSDEFVRKFMSRVRLKNLLRRSATYHFAIEVKLQAFYQRYRTKFIPVDPKQDRFFKEQQQNDPDAVFRSAIEDLCRTAQSNGVKTVLLFVPTLDELASTNQSRVLATKLTVSAKLGVPLLDLTQELSGGGKALYLEADPVHLNAVGNAIVARRLFEGMTNRLTQ